MWMPGSSYDWLLPDVRLPVTSRKRSTSGESRSRGGRAESSATCRSAGAPAAAMSLDASAGSLEQAAAEVRHRAKSATLDDLKTPGSVADARASSAAGTLVDCYSGGT